uniref:CRAL-TRIO domain-containing protein n=1 Tax=Heterorhabditis bacteriophora TaxID=37862 RepID=A0A1I7WUA2_HETBA
MVVFSTTKVVMITFGFYYNWHKSLNDKPIKMSSMRNRMGNTKVIVDFDLEFPKYFVVFLMPLLIHERLKIFFLHIDPEIERIVSLSGAIEDTCRGGGDPLIIGMVREG